MAQEPRTLTGGCHCGFIRYTVKVTPESDGTLTALRCNCTFCQKLANTNLHYHDPANFTLLSPSSKSEVHGYAVSNPNFPRNFCHKCGAHVWMDGVYEFPIGNGEMKRVQHCSVNLGTLDQPQEGIDLKDVKIRYWDGLNGNFHKGLREEPWTNGMK